LIVPVGDSEQAWTGYRRLIRIVPHPRHVDVDMEDDAHCFGVTIFHDGATIERVETREPRHPWTSCPMAGAFLRERMQGLSLTEAPDVEDQRQHCTHIYDLFILGVRHAHEHLPTSYSIRVADKDAEGRKLAQIDRNGTPLFSCADGQDQRALAAWSATLPDAMQEAARMLRRGALVALGRGMIFPVADTADALMDRMSGACFTFQPERAAQAVRVPDNVRDFSNTSEKMLAGEQDDRRAGGLSRP
jgi:hypothetical protein